MFHVKKLDFMFVRLYALHMNYLIGVEQIPDICVADPYYMHEGFLGVCANHREYARDYIVSFMLTNKDKGGDSRALSSRVSHPRCYPSFDFNHSFARWRLINLRCTYFA